MWRGGTCAEGREKRGEGAGWAVPHIQPACLRCARWAHMHGAAQHSAAQVQHNKAQQGQGGGGGGRGAHHGVAQLAHRLALARVLEQPRLDHLCRKAGTCKGGACGRGAGSRRRGRWLRCERGRPPAAAPAEGRVAPGSKADLRVGHSRHSRRRHALLRGPRSRRRHGRQSCRRGLGCLRARSRGDSAGGRAGGRGGVWGVLGTGDGSPWSPSGPRARMGSAPRGASGWRGERAGLREVKRDACRRISGLWGPAAPGPGHACDQHARWGWRTSTKPAPASGRAHFSAFRANFYEGRQVRRAQHASMHRCGRGRRAPRVGSYEQYRRLGFLR
jgi:hypothetical protein